MCAECSSRGDGAKKRAKREALRLFIELSGQGKEAGGLRRRSGVET